jgi:hypothetical protein
MLLAKLPQHPDLPKDENEKKGDIMSLASKDQQETDEIEEDPYRWVIIFAGFLAQAICISPLSSW